MGYSSDKLCGTGRRAQFWVACTERHSEGKMKTGDTQEPEVADNTRHAYLEVHDCCLQPRLWCSLHHNLAKACHFIRNPVSSSWLWPLSVSPPANLQQTKAYSASTPCRKYSLVSLRHLLGSIYSCIFCILWISVQTSPQRGLLDPVPSTVALLVILLHVVNK